MFVVDTVAAGYGKSMVLQGVSLEVKEGECTCLIGANGAGKSTLMRVISGLLRSVSGEVSIDNIVLTGLPPNEIVDLGVIQVPEGRLIFPQMTVEENLLLGARNHRAKSEAYSSFEKVYTLFPVLKKRKNQRGGTLSGGEQQMLAIGRGLMAKPRILLLDEPSIGLSPLLVAEVFSVVQELIKESIGVLLVEQNVSAALNVSSYGYVLERGHSVLRGSSQELLEDESIKKHYLGN
ncbi:MAG: ABC transporter ATP-binding protein [Dehalococcoidales bacterium]|nr:ABC transporter ATP-binding protein [Dehalococcoidales bacterium]